MLKAKLEHTPSDCDVVVIVVSVVGAVDIGCVDVVGVVFLLSIIGSSTKICTEWFSCK